MSSAMKEDENGNVEYFRILKIGYTDDSHKDRRFDQYYLHNPTCKVLKTIPNATQEQESRVQYKFRDLLYTRNEWFKYDQSIIDFFNDIRSLEELDKLPKNLIRGDKEILEKRMLARKILGYVVDPTNKKHKEIKREIENYINSMMVVLGDKIDEESIINYLRNDSSIDNSKVNHYLECKERKLTENYSEDPKINQEVTMFFNNYEQLTTIHDKLKILCECDLSDQAREMILAQIPDSDEVKSYYIALTPEKLKALSYNTHKIKKELKIVTFSPELLIDSVYSVFKVGDKILLSELKQKLADLYKRINYSKTPKANDIMSYFDISSYTTTIIINGSKKRAVGYELISSHEQEIRIKLKEIKN